MDTTQPARPQPMRRYFTIWAGQALSLLGSSLVQFALVWWLTRTTGSATVLAIATTMAVLPEIVIGPFAGTLVDRWDRRLVMIAADASIALATVLLAILYAVNAVQVWHVYALTFIRTTGGTFHWSAMSASTTLLVPEKHLSRIGGLNQALGGLANVSMPPLGALLLELMPIQGILSIDIGTALLAIMPLCLVPVPQPGRAAMHEPRSILADLGEGLRFVWRWPGLAIIVSIAMLVNLVWHPAMALLPIAVIEHFQGGALQLAWLDSAAGIGLVLGGITLGVWGGFKRRAITMMLAVTLMGVSIILLGLTPAQAFALAVGAMFLGGFAISVANGSLDAILQATVAPEMQGRVFTLVISGARAVSPLGLAVAGPVADVLGAQAWFLIAGVAQAAVCVGAFFMPAVMRVEKGPLGNQYGSIRITGDDSPGA